MLSIPKFKTQKELFAYIVDKEEELIWQKKETLKKADGVAVFPTIANKMDPTSKSTPSSLLDKEVLNVVAVINTTNILDSHKDVHIPGLWDKSLQENGNRIKHLQEHNMAFDKIIADKNDLKAYVKEYSWKELGYNVEGKTQALVFDSAVRKNRNTFMHKQYAEGNVDNHSVGMRYVKMVTCINDEDYGAQYEAWEKYFPMVVNKEEAEKSGFFWAVTEAKVIEGSAVVFGSNPITPTQSMKSEEFKVITELSDDDKIYLNAVKNWLHLE